jgi:creatinine amidohydrolase
MFLKSMCYHIRTADSLGFHGAVIFSGHAGPFTKDVPLLLKILQPYAAVRLDVLFGLAASSRFDDDKGLGGHAGRGETSILWATDPDCVDISRVPAPDAPGPHFAMGTLVRESSRRAGELMASDAAERLGTMAKQLLEDYARAQPEHRLLTFDQVEDIWEQEVRPLIKDLAAMQDLQPGQEPPSEDSRWYANWRVRYRG